MKNYFLLLPIVLFLSCSFEKKTNSKVILDDALKTFNWHEVDRYPAFETCHSENPKKIKSCFENTFSKTVLATFKSTTLYLSETINDTLLLNFHVSKTGDFVLKNIKIISFITEKIPEIERTLRHSLKQLPKLFPALKRNQPVETAFTLPIIIKN